MLVVALMLFTTIMNRKLFLTIAGVVGLIIGLIAFGAPAAILVSKGVAAESTAAAGIWVREVGALILAASLLVLLVRDHSDSPTLRAVLFANAALHTFLFPVEILAGNAGVITRLDGIVPNSILHLVFAGSFLFFAARCDAHRAPNLRSPRRHDA